MESGADVKSIGVSGSEHLALAFLIKPNQDAFCIFTVKAEFTLKKNNIAKLRSVFIFGHRFGLYGVLCINCFRCGQNNDVRLQGTEQQRLAFIKGIIRFSATAKHRNTKRQ